MRLYAQRAAQVARAENPEAVLRVCADPNNLPLSNERAKATRTRSREELARDLGRRVEYTYFPQRMGFVRNTLRQQGRAHAAVQVRRDHRRAEGIRAHGDDPSVHAIDVRAGVRVAQGLRECCETADDLLKLPPETRCARCASASSADRPARIGCCATTCSIAQSSTRRRAEIPRRIPAHVIEQDLAAGKIDRGDRVGTDRGFPGRAAMPAFPAWRAVPFMPDDAIKFDYEMSMGVRFGEKEWKETLDQWIGAHEAEVHEILASYRVPLLDARARSMRTSARQSGCARRCAEDDSAAGRAAA